MARAPEELQVPQGQRDALGGRWGTCLLPITPRGKCMIGHLTQLSPPLCQGNFGPRGLTGRKGNPGERVSHTVESAFSLWWVGGRGYTCLPTPLSGPRWASRTSCTCWGARQQGREAILHSAVTEGAPSRAYHHQCTSCELSSCVFVLLALLSCHLSQGDRGQKGVRGPPGVIGRPVSGGADDGCL